MFAVPRNLFIFAALAGASLAAAASNPATDANWRLGLVRSAAQKAQLAEVGLDHRDLYGVIHAESGWVARDGMGKNGVVSRGVAQFEPATAKAVGLRNPNDPVQSVEAAAVLLKEAAQWSSRKLEGMSLSPAEWHSKLREGVSIYYNLSTRARSAWNGRNSDRMPIETQQHIRNARHGALIASRIESGGRAGDIPAPAIARPQFAGAPAQVSAPALPATMRVAQRGGRVTATIAGLPRMEQIPGGLRLPQGTIQWARGS